MLRLGYPPINLILIKPHLLCVQVVLHGLYRTPSHCLRFIWCVNKFVTTVYLRLLRQHQLQLQQQLIHVISNYFDTTLKRCIIFQYEMELTLINKWSISVCPNGQYQENLDYDMCSTWFDINKCDDSTCDTTASGAQTRCNLNSDAKKVLNSSGQICEEGYSPGAPYGLDDDDFHVNAYTICPWCCNWCNTTDTAKGIFNLSSLRRD